MTDAERIQALSAELVRCNDRYNRLNAQRCDIDRRGRDADTKARRAIGLVAIIADRLDEAAADTWGDPHTKARQLARWIREQACLAGLAQ